MQPLEIHPWRSSPFVVGCCYRVQRDFTALRDHFLAGEILTFHSAAYSRYDSYTGYFFTQSGAPQLRVWDIHDDDDIAIWQTLFAEVPCAETHPSR